MIKGVKIIDNETYDEITHMIKEIWDNNHDALNMVRNHNYDSAEHLIGHNSSNIVRLLDKLSEGRK